jgi:glucosamine-phosphate N-acetyltransferase
LINLKNSFDNYKKENSKIYILKSVSNKNIIATGKILIEQKMHNNFSNMGHIEDIVVDENYRKFGLGKYIINKLTEYGFENDCYKIVLCCNDNNDKFYINCDYKKRNRICQI